MSVASATDMNSNTAVGYKAMLSESNASTAGNTIIGNEAGIGGTGQHRYNTAVGYQAFTTTGTNASDGNTCIGYQAGQGITDGNENICIGWDAGVNTVVLQGGDRNVLIGNAVRTSATGSVNQIVIGYDVQGTSDRRVHIGDSTNHLHTDFSSDSWSATSDKRQKKNIKDDSLGLEFIKSLRTTTYNHKSPSEFPKEWSSYDVNDKKPMDGDKVFHSLIAQEVKQSLDDIDCETFGGWSVDSDGRQRVTRGEFITPLIKAIQELSQQVEDLKKQINK